MLRNGGRRVSGNASAIPRDGNFRSTTRPVFERSDLHDLKGELRSLA